MWQAAAVQAMEAVNDLLAERERARVEIQAEKMLTQAELLLHRVKRGQHPRVSSVKDPMQDPAGCWVGALTSQCLRDRRHRGTLARSEEGLEVALSLPVQSSTTLGAKRRGRRSGMEYHHCVSGCGEAQEVVGESVMLWAIILWA